jgi:hypothetical protein
MSRSSARSKDSNARVRSSTDRVRDPGYDYRTELCHHWMTPKGAQTYLDKLRGDAKHIVKMGLNPESTHTRVARFLAKAKTIGMKLDKEQTGTRSVNNSLR